MSEYVLIHGAWHGAFCWHKIVPILEKAGHIVKAPDLPGHGADPAPIADVSLEAYVKRIGEVLDGCAEPVILVGHSMAGFIVSQVAEERPAQVRTLVYLAAFLPQSGQTLGELAREDADALVGQAIMPTADEAGLVVRPELARLAFYADCSDEDVESALPRLRPEPASILEASVTLTPARYGQVPRVYIECVEDRAISIDKQRAMVRASPCRVISMSTSHSPFYAAPEALGAHLLAIGGDRLGVS